MTTTTTPARNKTAGAGAPDAATLARILDEGYGPGAWHGADMKAAASK